MRVRFTLPATLFAATLALAGCVGNDLERATAGAIIGGVGAAATGGDIAAGVVVGGAAGALCDDVNLC
jgi:hypothetical protein